MQKRFIEYDLPLADISEESAQAAAHSGERAREAKVEERPPRQHATHQHASRIPCHNPSRTPTDGSKRRWGRKRLTPPVPSSRRSKV